MRVAIAFNKLSNAIQPTPAGINKARLHIGSIKTRLANSFAVSRSLIIGSIARDTAVRGASDVDLLAVIRRDEIRRGDTLITSDTFIKKIRDDLNDRFPSTTVRRDGQAVVVHFGNGTEPVDVVPSIFHQFRGNSKSPVYLIPDGLGGWMETAPEAHSSYLRSMNEATTGKLRKTIQLIKHWRNCRNPSLPLMSLHLELLLASSKICVGAKSYSHCLRDAFSLLKQRECRGLHDPLGISGVIYAVQTAAQHEKLVAAVDYALEHSQRAVEAESNRRWEEALHQWGIVFNGAFPHA